MKTSVIEIEIHDDIGSLEDKILWSQSNRILLVDSPQTKLLRKRINQTLLKRHVNRLGAQLAFVTFHVETIQIADDLRIPIFPSIRKAQYENWHADQKIKNDILLKRMHGKIIKSPDIRKAHADAKNSRLSMAMFIVGALAPILLVLSLTPTATVSFPPDVGVQKEDMQLLVSVSSEAAYVSINAKILTEMIDESMTATATGKITIPDKAAKGLVRFTNLTEHAILIPKGTMVRTGDPEKTEFFSITDTLVPAGVGKTVDCPFQATLPGLGGNIESRIIQFLEGPLSTELNVINPQPMVGGTIIELNAVSQEDLTNARTILSETIKQSVLKSFQEKITEEYQLLPGTLSMKSEIESFTPGLDQPADYFVYSLKRTFIIWTYSTHDLAAIANKMMDQTIATGFFADPESLKFTFINQISDTADQTIALRFEATREIQKEINPTLPQEIAGLSKQKAIHRLEEALKLKKAPTIHIFPSWWPWLPLLPIRISLGYQER